MANTNTEIIAMLETNPSQAIRGVLDTLYLYNPATVNDLIAQLNDVINKVGFEAIVVNALPETGKKGTIYFVPSGGKTPNVYNEYVWVTETEKFEMVGSAQVDLSNYYTKDEIDNQFIDIVGYVGDETRPLRNDINQLDKNIRTVADWVNAKDEEGNRAVLETEAQDAFRAINELNAKIGSGGGASLPDQTDNAGKFLMTDGTTASWQTAIRNLYPYYYHSLFITYDNQPLSGNNGWLQSSVVILSGEPKWWTLDSNGNTSIVISGGNVNHSAQYSVTIGYGVKNNGYASCVAIGYLASTGKYDAVTGNMFTYGQIAIGANAQTSARYAIQIGKGTNNDAQTLKISNEFGNYEYMSADGTIPTDRYTTTPTTAGTYIPKLTIAEDGTATREWGTASSGGGGVSGDYLPLSGGTLTGDIEIIKDTEDAQIVLGYPGYADTPLGGRIKVYSDGIIIADRRYGIKIATFSSFGGLSISNNLDIGKYGAPKDIYLTGALKKNDQAFEFPTEGGTLARLEDLNDITTVTIKEYD